MFAQLGSAGLLSLPQPEEWGGGGQPFEVYLQVLEEIAARWAAVAVAVSVHSLSCHPLLAFGTDEQRRRWLPGMLSGEQIGAYSLSEPQAGSDAAALRCSARCTADGTYVINGSKSWITHGGRADFIYREKRFTSAYAFGKLEPPVRRLREVRLTFGLMAHSRGSPRLHGR